MCITKKETVAKASSLKHDDVVQKSMGPMGKWHFITCGFLFLAKFPVAFHQLGNIFLAPPVSFTCLNNITDACSGLCPGYVYDRSVFSETIITQWNLICQNEYLSNLSQTIFMLGILMGNIAFGIFSDKFGRRKPLLVAALFQLLFGVSTSFSPFFWFFCLTRFGIGFATGGTMITSFVLLMEIIGINWRELIGVLFHIPFSMGHLLLPGISYLFRDWKYFQFVISIFSVVFITYYWFVPESPRWLLVAGRTKEATEILKEAARQNKLPTINIENEIEKYYKENVQSRIVAKGKISDLFRTPNLRKRTICIYYNWFALSVALFGVTQYVSKVGSDIFSSVAISAALSIPCNLFSIYISRSWGRKWSMIFGNSLVSIPMLCIAASNSENVTIALASISLMGTSISFPITYIYSSEIMPTVVRNVGMGGASVVGRIGAMIAPFIASLSLYYSWLSPVLIGVIGIIGVLLCFFLPETRGERLPAIINDAETFKT